MEKSKRTGQVQILADTPAVLSLGKLCEEHGYTLWVGQRSKVTPDQTREEDSLQDGKFRTLLLSLDCRRILVPARLLHRLPQDSPSTSSSPATERSDDRAPGNWRDSPKNQNNNQKRDNDGAWRDRLRDLPEWLEVFTENLEGYRSVCARTNFSWPRFGTAYKSGIQEAQYF